MGVMYRDHVAPMAHVQVVPDFSKSPAADYLFEGDTRDSSGNDNMPVVAGAPKLVPGKHGQALSFEGSDSYLALPPRLGDSTDFSFTAWVKWNGGGMWQRVFDLGNTTANNLFLTARSGGETLRFSIKQNNGAEQQLNAPLLPVGVWTHVAVTLGGDTGKLFVNGALVATNNAMTINPGALGTLTNYLGKSQYPDPLFNGTLDSVRFFTTALSDAQVANAASSATLQFDSDPLVLEGALPNQTYATSLIDHASAGNGGRTFAKVSGPAWLAVAADGTLTGVPLSGDTGKNTCLVRVTDSFGLIDTATVEIPVAEVPGMVARYAFNGNTTAAVGTLQAVATGTPAYNTGKFSGAVDLDAVDDFVTLPPGIANHDEITFATWVWWDGGGQWQRIFDFGNGTAESMFLTPRSGGNALMFSINKDGVAHELTTSQLVTGAWTHIAVTLGGGTCKLYVNGLLADTEAVTLKPSDIRPATNYLGKSQFPDPLFDGRIDEFAVFNRALTGPQVTSLYIGTLPSFTSDPFAKPAASVGATYSNSITAIGVPLTYSKAGGPRWLTVEPDGRISGIPTHADAGSNRFLVRATKASGIADDATMTITVTPPSRQHALYQFHNVATDSDGGFHGTANGGPAYTAAIFDQAIDLDGTDDHVTLPSGFINSLTNTTIAARFRWDGGNDWQRVFDFGTGTNAYLFLSPGFGGTTMRFAIKNSGAEQTLQAPAAPVGDWTHVAITLIGNTGTLYVNGAPVDTKTITLDPANFLPTLNYLGKSQYAADPFFNGAIDDFRIYNDGLSAAEIAGLVIPPSPYESWAAGIAFPLGQDSPGLDPDNDQIANLLEFLLGSDPLVSSAAALPQAQTKTAGQLGLPGSKNYLTISARLRASRDGHTVTAEAAATPADLALPAAAGHAIQAGAPVADGAFEIVTWYYDVAIEDGGTGFMRLRARTD